MADDKESGGVWRTVCGRRIFIRKGQSLTDAMRESGKFKKSDIDSAKSESAKSAPKSDTPTKYGGKSSKEFSAAVKKAKETVPAEKAWRVTAHTQEELDQDYPGAKLHTTKGGSTVAVTQDGDIVSVCKNGNDRETRGRDLLAMAVENGGKKLDSYSGNHSFYTKCGFEPVSWCEWNDEYAPDGWTEERDAREPIIFYKYTGKMTRESAEDFFARVSASKDYDAAKNSRDKSMK